MGSAAGSPSAICPPPPPTAGRPPWPIARGGSCVGDAKDVHLFFTYGANGAYASVGDPFRHRNKANDVFYDGHVQGIAETANAYLGSANSAPRRLPGGCLAIAFSTY